MECVLAKLQPDDVEGATVASTPSSPGHGAQLVASTSSPQLVDGLLPGAVARPRSAADASQRPSSREAPQRQRRPRHGGCRAKRRDDEVQLRNSET